MKELSIEEKAKAYDKAISEIRNLRDMLLEEGVINKKGIICNNFNRIFPELKESEDERIKKEIIRIADIWTNSAPVVNGIPREVLLAWLEKQGEPIDINPSEFDLRLNKLLKQFETLPKEELASSLSFYLNVVQNDGTYREEKQGEQKSAEWSKEDERMLDIILNDINYAQKNFSDSKLIPYDRKVDWFKSIKERVQPQNITVTDEELTQAKKEAYNDALDKIEYHSGEPTFDDGWSAATWYLKKRNVQPQSTWKPSDEQITWLYRAADDANKDSRMKQILNELLSDLKKLREK